MNKFCCLECANCTDRNPDGYVSELTELSTGEHIPLQDAHALQIHRLRANVHCDFSGQ